MPRGGSRSGAGRKKGAATEKTRAIVDRAATEGIMPLEVQLATIRALWALAAPNGKVTDLEKALEACEISKDADPYCHPRLAAIEHTGKDGQALVIPAVHILIGALPDDD